MSRAPHRSCGEVNLNVRGLRVIPTLQHLERGRGLNLCEDVLPRKIRTMLAAIPDKFGDATAAVVTTRKVSGFGSFAFARQLVIVHAQIKTQHAEFIQKVPDEICEQWSESRYVCHANLLRLQVG
jgi:hypothetical protein